MSDDLLVVEREDVRAVRRVVGKVAWKEVEWVER